MANISGSTNEKIFQLKQWGGLNEAPDGDAKLKLGEASVMTNWKVTRDGNLKRRPGSEFVCGCRNIYAINTADTAQEVFSTDDPDAEVTMYQYASLGNVPGTVVLDTTGTAATVSVDNASSYANWHFTYKGKLWKFVEITQSSGVYSWKGKRVTATPSTPGTYGISGMWTGWLNNVEVMLVACPNSLGVGGVKQGFIYKIDTTGSYVTRTALHNSAISMPGNVHMFGFEGKVYFLTGDKYYQYDGTTFSEVVGYEPLIAISLAPDGQNELLESVNLLTLKRRVWISPDGKTDDDNDPNVTGRTFQLPEKDITSVDYVKNLATKSTVNPNDYGVNTNNGTVTFNNAPIQSVNSYEIGYTAKAPTGVNYRAQVEKMRFSELYSGTQDTRVFIYGDGTNQCLYSGLDYWGEPRADYFPDLNACAVGDSNTPITAMIRHYSTLVCYKRASAWSLTYGVMALTNDTLAPAFYGTPVNRRLGNEPMGQVVLVDNSPVTLTGGEVYQWQNSSYYSSNLTQDERQAKRISDRIQSSIKEFDLAHCMCYDDNYGQEYYICCGDTALVWNYVANAWYKYEDFDAVAMCNYGGELYYGTHDGKIMHLTYEVPDNDFEPIEAHWESGAMDFGQDYMRKYSAMLWVGIKPDDETEVTVTVRTDRKEEYNEKIVSSERARVEGEPYMRRSKIKAKKFTHYTLIFKSDGEGNAPTVNSADIRVRFTGYAKG